MLHEDPQDSYWDHRKRAFAITIWAAAVAGGLGGYAAFRLLWSIGEWIFG